MFYTVGLTIALVVLFIAYLLIEDRKKTAKYAHIPGPRGIPIIGNLHQLNRLRPEKSFTEWSNKYGPVIKVSHPGHTYVVANGYEALHEMLVEKGVEFGGRHRGYRDSITAANTGVLRMDASDRKWRICRRLIQQSVKAFGSGINRIEHYAMQTSEEYIQVFANTKGQPVNPQDIMYDGTLRMITLMLYGRKLDQNDPIFQMIKDMIKELNSMHHPGGDGPQLDMFPWLRFFGNKSYKNAVTSRKLRDEVDNWYLTQVAPMEDVELDDKLGRPLAKVLRDHNKGLHPDDEEYLTMDMINSTMLQMLFAGVASTTTTLYEAILLMLTHPECEQRIYKETEDVLGDRLVTLNDRDKMPYVNAFILEVLRFTCSGPIGIPHKVVCDETLQGYMIPRGTVVLSNFDSIANDRNFWGDPTVFRPERFLDEKGQLLSPDHENRRHFMQFGLGPRICAGRLFALYRLFLWVVNLVQRFEIKPEDPNNLPAYDPELYTLDGISLRPPSFKAKFLLRGQGCK